MVLELPGGLFGQSDVRETATEEGTTTGTLYWSCSGMNFSGVEPETSNITYGNLSAEAQANGISLFAPVFLPHGAVVTKCIVDGNAGAIAGEQYTLKRLTRVGGATADMATANIGTEDISISNAIINNNTYCYFLQTSSMDTGDAVYGARITYTL